MVTEPGANTKSQPRNQTKGKILRAATQTFVALGPAGARVDAIAAAAGVNKRMLYHHYGDKQGLYQAVLAASVADPDISFADRARLLAWEGLYGSRASSSLGNNLAPTSDSVAELESEIEALPEASAKQALDTQMFLLLQRALEVFPHVFGPEVERITGLAPEGEAFNAALERLADQVQQQLDPSRQVQPPRIEAKTKVRLRARSKPRPDTAY